MKKIISTALLLSIFAMNVSAKKVKFAVDMTGQIINTTGIHISGDFQTIAGFPGGDWASNTTPLTQEGTTDIYISDQPGVGWNSNSSGDVEAYGALWDYVNHRLVDSKVESLQAIQDHSSFKYAQLHDMPEELYLHLPVYNLEVEDFHTYYVGQHGVWVHNTNCSGLNFEMTGTPSPGASFGLTAEMSAKPFLTRAELNEFLTKNNIKSGVFLVRADAKSQAGLIAEKDLAKWLQHEEGVAGRLKTPDNTRWEYAAAIRHPETGKLT